ncbi:hypothetical protein IW261DRAFT_1421212 [Armillaria novae-zelandiae]|uniref:Uncharacterized protein n=1 Tax=Armillaria novae-zelandiae TaxID=153914 RepID=A0AA39P4Y7_9AGAR|nr:hypothetical protein IW261DRAFT_1421212 [Armillaria novae-zelandiae]
MARIALRYRQGIGREPNPNPARDAAERPRRGNLTGARTSTKAQHWPHSGSLTLPTIATLNPPEVTLQTPESERTLTKHLKNVEGRIAGGRKEIQPKTPTKRRTASSALLRLPLGTLLTLPADFSGELSDDNSQAELQTPSPTSPGTDIFMDENPLPAAPVQNVPPPAAPGQNAPPPAMSAPDIPPVPPPQVFAFPTNKDDLRLFTLVSANDSPHRNGAEFIPYGPKHEKQVACLQPNLGNFEGSVFHRDDILDNLNSSQLDSIMQNVGGYLLGVLFNGGRKLVDVSKPKPWEVLNKTFIPLLEGNETLKVYQGLPEMVPEDKLAPPFIVVIEAAGDIRDVLLRQRILALNDNLALHVVPATCKDLSWAVWLFKANEPIITGTAEEIEGIGETLRFIILKNLWEDGTFRTLLYPMTRNRMDHPTKAILDAITASYVKYRGARDTHYWVFFMKPPSLTISAKEWNILCTHVQKKTIRNGNISISPALPRTGNQFCTICKLDMHPTFDCSFTRDNTVFQGPTKPLIGGQHEGRPPRGRGGGQGNRGRGGQSEYKSRGSRGVWDRNQTWRETIYTTSHNVDWSGPADWMALREQPSLSPWLGTVMANATAQGGDDPATDYQPANDSSVQVSGSETSQEVERDAERAPGDPERNPGSQNNLEQVRLIRMTANQQEDLPESACWKQSETD